MDKEVKEEMSITGPNSPRVHIEIEYRGPNDGSVRINGIELATSHIEFLWNNDDPFARVRLDIIPDVLDLKGIDVRSAIYEKIA